MSLLPELTPQSLPSFRYVSPTTVEETIALLRKYGRHARITAGGSDLLYLMKRDAAANCPEILIDTKGISGLRSIEFDARKGLKIGALATLSRLEESQTVRRRYSTLAQAAASVGSVQIRNVATVGGTFCQQVWCWFLREGLRCWRSGAKRCYALHKNADNRYYGSIMGGKDCFSVHPSDIAVAARAFDAKFSVAGPDGSRQLGFEEFLPGNAWVDGELQSHSLGHYDMLTHVEIPPPRPNTFGVYVRIAVGDGLSFPIATLAVLLTLKKNRIDDARVVFGGVAPAPYRDQRVEDSLKGQRLTRKTRDMAASVALKDATPFSDNAYKVDAGRGLVKEALASLFRN